MSDSEKKEIYTNIYKDIATIIIYSNEVADLTVLEISSLFEKNYTKVKILNISIVKDELFISFQLPEGWGQTEVEKVAADISTKI